LRRLGIGFPAIFTQSSLRVDCGASRRNLTNNFIACGKNHALNRAKELALLCSSAFSGLYFRCLSVNALFCRANRRTPVSSRIFTRASPWGALKQTLRVHLRACFKIQ